MNKRYYEHTLSTTREFIEYLHLKRLENKGITFFHAPQEQRGFLYRGFPVIG